ncbi:MAG: DUF1018 domain-containing protein [Thermosipho sp. (in: Bacteria)]|nr:DUF1018 domain-containing protein [Thermosipho sp. (in: thermotogales)]
MIEKVKEIKKREEILREQAKKMIPEKYLPFLIFLEQNQKILNMDIEIDPELARLGVFSYRGATYIKTQVPYFSVDGRVAWAVDEAKEAGKPFKVDPPEYTEIGDQMVCIVRVHTARGEASGTAKVGFGGRSVDATNPVENAETSALGRALGFLGYGLVGTGIASYEEVVRAMAEHQELEQQARPATEKQKNILSKKGNMEMLGLTKEKIEKLTFDQADKLIKQLFNNSSSASAGAKGSSNQSKDKGADKAQGQNTADERKIKYLWVLLEKVAKKQGKDKQELAGLICQQYGIEELEQLTNQQAQMMINSLKQKLTA